MRMSSTTILCFLFLGLFVYTEQLATDQKKKKVEKNWKKKIKLGRQSVAINCKSALTYHIYQPYLPGSITHSFGFW